MSMPIERTVLDLYDSRRLSDHLLALQVLRRAQQARLGAPPGAPTGLPTTTVEVVDDLPALAWSCRIQESTYGFRVGPQVDHGRGYVFEGVWDGAPDDRDFHRSEHVFGSGARIGKHVIFVPPRHCWEFLFVLHAKLQGFTVVSNSLSFALAELGVDIDSEFGELVARRLRTSTDQATAMGADLYDPLVADDGEFSLHRMMFHNFTVDGEGHLRVLALEPTIPFTTFDEYREHLLTVMGAVAANGADPARRSPLRPLTPISGGYDSPAVGALASRLGFTEAVTIAVTVKGRDDSGFAVGKMLGLDVAQVRHFRGEIVPRLAMSVDSESLPDFAEFIATAGLGDDVMLRTMEPYLRGAVMFSGAMGDSAWKRASTLPPGLPVRVVYGKSFSEFRLRVGFAFVPVPAIGARYSYGVRRITRSAEMAPWTLNQPYDRPIARRLIEEARVPRGAFAKAKAATNPSILNYSDLFRPAMRLQVDRYRRAIAGVRAA